MQPSVGLSYSSQGGNGIAGVGWSLSATSTIYLCPWTLAQENSKRSVRRDGQDRLCYGGKRLVASNGPASYGTDGTEYRPEIDDSDRIVQRGGDLRAGTTTFEVHHKSGRTSYYKSLGSNSGQGPDKWYLFAETDQQGNCIAYTYDPFNSVTGSTGITDQE